MHVHFTVKCSRGRVLKPVMVSLFHSLLFCKYINTIYYQIGASQWILLVEKNFAQFVKLVY